VGKYLALAEQVIPQVDRADKYPPDEVGGDPCPNCGAAERWIWLDGRRRCRPGLITGRAPATASKEVGCVT
jgi:hypothetical protein